MRGPSHSSKFSTWLGPWGHGPSDHCWRCSGAAGTEKFWDHFERDSYKPGHVTPRDMSDASGSDTDPKGPVVPYNAYDDVNFEIMV